MPHTKLIFLYRTRILYWSLETDLGAMKSARSGRPEDLNFKRRIVLSRARQNGTFWNREKMNLFILQSTSLSLFKHLENRWYSYSITKHIIIPNQLKLHKIQNPNPKMNRQKQRWNNLTPRSCDWNYLERFWMRNKNFIIMMYGTR